MLSNLDPNLVDAIIQGGARGLSKLLGEKSLPLLTQGAKTAGDKIGEVTEDLLVKIFRKYVDSYDGRHGQIKVIGMHDSVGLESIYTKVKFRDSRCLIDDENLFRNREYLHGDRHLAMDVANEKQYMMVLGNAGSGKTTFLRKVGIEALKYGFKSKYNHRCVPVFLELRDQKLVTDGEIDLVEAIGKEFANCGLPRYGECTEEFLKQGKLLIILDGLDEVKKEYLPSMIREIRNLLDTYPKNRFIASCRIKAYEHFQDFQRFSDVYIADFDEEQKKNFIDLWFTSHEREGWGKECWKKLTSNNNQGINELTKTPLLLALICILFNKTGEFPQKRSTLYSKTLSVLLSEWDASKLIDRHEVSCYQGLDSERKKLLLADIAYDNFVDNCLYFQEDIVKKQIVKSLKDILPEEKYINGEKVLYEIESKHGLLVKRDMEHYSFSHLTLQEYLTAYYINEQSLDLNAIVDQYLFDKRWREVFLLLAGLKAPNDLLLAMEKKIHSLINTPKLRDLLRWVEKYSDDTSGEIKVMGKRAICLNNPNCFYSSYNDIRIGDEMLPFAYGNVNSDEIVKAYFQGDTGDDMEVMNMIPNLYSFANGNINSIDTYNNIRDFIEYGNWSQEYKIYKNVDLENTMYELEKLIRQIPANDLPKEVHCELAQKLVALWHNTFHLTPEMINLSEKESDALIDYFYGVLLMINCKDGANRYSQEIWKGIESRLFLYREENQS